MSNFSALIATIQANIKTNGQEEITGAILQDVLEAMVSALGTEAINNLETSVSTLSGTVSGIEGKIPSAATSSNKLTDKAYVDAADTTLTNAVNAIEDAIENGYVYAGIATPSGTPVTGKVFYLALTAGTYTDFGGLTVTQGINILKYNGTAWSQEQLIGIDNVPTAGSSNLVRSGGVQNELALGAVYDVSAKNPTAGPNNDGMFESLSALLSDANLNTLIPTAVRKGGMSIKFVQSSDNKYAFYKLLANTFSITESLWEKMNVDSYPTAGSDNLVKSSGVAMEMQFRGGALQLATKIDSTYISAFIGNGTTSVTIKQMLFMKRNKQSTSSYYYPQQETLEIPQTANIVVIGVMYNPTITQDTSRYSYYTSGGDIGSFINNDECFEPIATCYIYGSSFEIRGGVLFDAIQLQDLIPQKLNIANNPSIKFRGGLLQLYTKVDESYISTVDTGTEVQINIKQMLFMRRTVQSTSSYYYPPQETLSVSRNANLVVLGVIYNSTITQDTARYGYYTSGGDVSTLADDESFEPIAILEIANGIVTSKRGMFYQLIEISELKKEITKLSKVPSNILYENNMKTLDGLGAILLGTGTSVPIQNAASVVSDGVEVIQYNAVLPLINTRFRDSHIRITLNTSTAEHVLFDTYGMEGGYEGLVFLATLDFANDVIRFYSNELVSYTFNQNEDYVVDFHRIDKHDTLTITRVKTGIKTLIGTYNGQTGGNQGLMYDIIAIENNGGNSPIIKSYVVESSVKFPKFLIYGDSITTGYFATVSEGLNTNCYAYKVGEASGLEWQSSARGGGFFDGLLGGTSRGMSYIGRMNVELPKVRPNFVMVTIGTNGAATYSQYQSVIEKILQYGGTPILNTLPIRADLDGVHNNSEISANNAIIMQIWKDYNLHGARLDLATSLNNDGNTINTALFHSDLIHPNDAGHQAIYERILVDCPELFFT